MIQLTMINLMIKMISLLSRFLLTSKLWFCRLLAEHYSPLVARRNAIISVLYWRKCIGVNTMEHGMLFVVIAVIPIISTISLSPLNSSRPESSTRLLISMDVTPRRPIHRAEPRRQSTRSFSFISISRASYSSLQERSALKILFHLVSSENANY